MKPFRHFTVYLETLMLCAFLVSCVNSPKDSPQPGQTFSEELSNTALQKKTPTPFNVQETAEPAFENPEFFHLQTITAENIADILPLAVLEDSGRWSSLSPDAEMLALSSFYGVSVYNTSTAEKTVHFQTKGSVLKTAFSADGTRLAVLHELPRAKDQIVLRTDKSETSPITINYGVSVWDILQKSLLFSKTTQEICGPKPSTKLFQFLNDGTLFLDSLDFDNQVQSICRISTDDGSKLEQTQIDPTKGYVRSLALSNDGEYYAAVFSETALGISNPSLSIFHFQDNQETYTKSLSVWPNLAFIPGTDRLVYNQLSSENVYSLEIISSQGQEARSLPIPAASVQTPFFSVNQDYISLTYENEVLILDLHSGEVICSIPSPPQQEDIPENFNLPYPGIGETNLLPELDILMISQVFSQEIRIFDLHHPDTPIYHFKGTPPLQTLGDLSPDGSLVASCGFWNGEIHLWSTRNGELQQILRGHESLVTQVLFSPDGSQLASTATDGTIRLWDVQSGALFQIFEGHQGWVVREAFSEDGSRLASTATDNTIKIWNTKNGQELGSFPNPVPEGVIDHLHFTGENTLLVFILPNLGTECNGRCSAAFLLDLTTGEIKEKAWELLAVSISPEQEWLLRYGSADSGRFSIGKMENGDFLENETIVTTSLNDSREICLSADSNLIFSFNQNGLNVLDRKSGEQIALAANHFGLMSSGEGKLVASPDGRFLLEFSRGSILMWGIPE